jgi:hypothetical protein
MKIDRRVPPRLNDQVKESMGGKQAEHMIQKRDRGGDFVLAQAIQIQVNFYPGLLGRSRNLYFAPHGFSLIQGASNFKL